MARSSIPGLEQVDLDATCCSRLGRSGTMWVCRFLRCIAPTVRSLRLVIAHNPGLVESLFFGRVSCECWTHKKSQSVCHRNNGGRWVAAWV